MNKNRVLPRHTQLICAVSELMHTHCSPFPQLCTRTRRSLDPKVAVKQPSLKIYYLGKRIKSKSAKKKAPQNIKPWKYSHSLFLLWFFDSLTVSEKLWSLANCFLFPGSRAACATISLVFQHLPFPWLPLPFPFEAHFGIWKPCKYIFMLLLLLCSSISPYFHGKYILWYISQFEVS